MFLIVDVLYQWQIKDIVYNNLSIENLKLDKHNQILLCNFEDTHFLSEESNKNIDTENWNCSDVILHNKNICKISREAMLKADVFSLGILLYYNEKQKNPFEYKDTVEENILTNKYLLEYLEYTLHDLIFNCLKQRYVERISIKEVYNHPYFWSADKIFNFLAHLSDFLEYKKEFSYKVYTRLERNKHKLYEDVWSLLIDDIIINEIKNFRLYNEKSVKGLLRAIRNKGRHFKELPDEIKIIYKNFPKGYVEYFVERFPALLMVCYHSARIIRDDELLCNFYDC